MGFIVVSRPVGGVAVSVKIPKKGRNHHVVFYLGRGVREATDWAPGDRIRVLWGTGDDTGKCRMFKHPDGFKFTRSGQLTVVMAGEAQTMPSSACNWRTTTNSAGLMTIEIDLPRQIARRGPIRDVTASVLGDPKRTAA